MAKNPKDVRGFIAANLPAPDAGKLEQVRACAAEARDIEAAIADLEFRLAEEKKKLTELVTKKLVDLMDEAGVNTLGIDASGNLPAIELKVRPFYSAGISADWPEEKKAEGFKALEEVGAGDLVKRTITVALPKGKESQQQAKVLRNFLLDEAIPFNEAMAVHAQTLKKWVRETHEAEGKLPDLEKIGAQIGRIVELKEKKPK